jgi:hypothetical protein
MNQFNDVKTIPNIPFANRNDARILAYQYYKDEVEKDIKTILELIEKLAKRGLIQTDQVILMGYERIHFVIDTLLVLGFTVRSEEVVNNEGIYRLTINWG